MNDAVLNRLAARADLCRLLAACYYEPGPEFVEEGLFDSLAEAAGRIDDDIARRATALGASFTERPLDALRIDYTRLFLHPTAPQALPYESSWMAGVDPVRRQEAIETVARCYADHGFEVDEGFRDLPDHIAAELEFLYVLLFREAAACSADDERARAEAAAARCAFVARHLGRWIGPFARAMREGAETAFYRSLADLTEAFVVSEGEEGERVAPAPGT